MTKKLKIFISGQKRFGGDVLRMILSEGHTVVGVCCPLDDTDIGKTARLNSIPIVLSGTLCHSTMPDNVDLGITAHSFDYIGKKTRYKPKFGWIGFHPSLLPLHRGRSSIEWTLRMKDVVYGGTVFWLNSGIDRGDIACQGWGILDQSLCNGDIKKNASRLWREEIQPMGIDLLRNTVRDISSGIIPRTPQNHKLGSWEPCTDSKDIYKPDLLMIDYIN